MAAPRRPRRHPRVREAGPSRYEAAHGVAGVLYDSDVIIEILRGRRLIVDAAAALEAAGVQTYCTPIAWAEIYAGLRPGEEPVARAFFEARGEVMIDGRVGRRAGSYLARYARSHGVEIADAFVAASAATAGLTLWTLNRKHYPMPDVQFYDR